jgi:hypothetical protein
MKKNMGSIDKAIRLSIALTIVILIATNVLAGAAAVIGGLLALIFVLTSIAGFCPLYALTGLSTCKKPSHERI